MRKKRKFERKQEELKKKDADITTTRRFFFAVLGFHISVRLRYALMQGQCIR